MEGRERKAATALVPPRRSCSRCRPSPAADKAAWLFRPGHVTRIDLGLSPASGMQEPGEYVPATFKLRRCGGAVHGPLRVGVRLKGFSSFRPLSEKAAFRIGPGSTSRVSGSWPEMVLTIMVQDSTMLREPRLAAAFRAAGLLAWRTGYSFVRVDGRAYGLYLNLESPDAISVARWYPTTGTCTRRRRSTSSRAPRRSSTSMRATRD